MSKFLFRIVAILMVPFLILDPMASEAMASPNWPNPLSMNPSLQGRFNEEALAGALGDPITPLIKKAKLFWTMGSGSPFSDFGGLVPEMAGHTGHSPRWERTDNHPGHIQMSKRHNDGSGQKPRQSASAPQDFSRAPAKSKTPLLTRRQWMRGFGIVGVVALLVWIFWPQKNNKVAQAPSQPIRLNPQEAREERIKTRMVAAARLAVNRINAGFLEGSPDRDAILLLLNQFVDHPRLLPIQPSEDNEYPYMYVDANDGGAIRVDYALMDMVSDYYLDAALVHEMTHVLPRQVARQKLMQRLHYDDAKSLMYQDGPAGDAFRHSYKIYTALGSREENEAHENEVLRYGRGLARLQSIPFSEYLRTQAVRNPYFEIYLNHLRPDGTVNLGDVAVDMIMNGIKIGPGRQYVLIVTASKEGIVSVQSTNKAAQGISTKTLPLSYLSDIERQRFRQWLSGWLNDPKFYEIPAGTPLATLRNELPVLGASYFAPAPEINPYSTSRYPSLGEKATERLIDAIFTGVLQPGTAIGQLELAKQFRVSQAVVRDAFNRLEYLGLIDKPRNRGASVKNLTRLEVVQHIELRILLEKKAFIDALNSMTEQDVVELRQLANAMADANRPYAEVQFHRRIWQLAHNSFLYQSLDSSSCPLFAFGALLSRNPLQVREARVASAQALIGAMVSKNVSAVKNRLTGYIFGAYHDFYSSNTPDIRSFLEYPSKRIFANIQNADKPAALEVQATQWSAESGASWPVSQFIRRYRDRGNSGKAIDELEIEGRTIKIGGGSFAETLWVCLNLIKEKSDSGVKAKEVAEQLRAHGLSPALMANHLLALTELQLLVRDRRAGGNAYHYQLSPSVRMALEKDPDALVRLLTAEPLQHAYHVRERVDPAELKVITDALQSNAGDTSVARPAPAVVPAEFNPFGGRHGPLGMPEDPDGGAASPRSHPSGKSAPDAAPAALIAGVEEREPFAKSGISRETAPIRADKFGNPLGALEFPHFKDAYDYLDHGDSVRTHLSNDRLYYGLYARDVEWFLDEAILDKSGNKPLTLDEIVNTRDARYVVGRIQPEGRWVIRRERDALQGWNYSTKQNFAGPLDKGDKGKIEDALQSALKTLGYTLKELELVLRERSHSLKFEVRSLHDFKGERDRNTDTIILHKSLLDNPDALLIVMIDEIRHVMTGEEDETNTAPALKVSAKAIGVKRLFDGLVALGTSDLVLAQVTLLHTDIAAKRAETIDWSAYEDNFAAIARQLLRDKGEALDSQGHPRQTMPLGGSNNSAGSDAQKADRVQTSIRISDSLLKTVKHRLIVLNTNLTELLQTLITQWLDDPAVQNEVREEILGAENSPSAGKTIQTSFRLTKDTLQKLQHQLIDLNLHRQMNQVIILLLQRWLRAGGGSNSGETGAPSGTEPRPMLSSRAKPRTFVSGIILALAGIMDWYLKAHTRGGTSCELAKMGAFVLPMIFFRPLESLAILVWRKFRAALPAQSNRLKTFQSLPTAA